MTAIALRAQPRDHFAFGARHAFETAESFEVLRARVGDQPDGGPRDLYQRRNFAGAVGTDFDYGIAMRRLPGAAM